MIETDKWQKETEKKIRQKLGMSDDDPTATNPAYWKEWRKASYKRENKIAMPIEYTITEDELENYPSYGWPLKCSWCRFGTTRIKAQNCNGLVFLCSECGRPNIVKQDLCSITISPGFRFSRWMFALILAICVSLWIFFKYF